MSFIITVQPTVEPITLAEAKMHLRVDSDFEDALIQDYIKAARAHVERFTGLSFTVQTIRAVIKTEEDPLYPWTFPNQPVPQSYELPLSPVSEITTVTDGTNPVEYTANLLAIPATITPTDMPDQLVVTYTTNTTAMAPDVKTAMLMILHQLYDMRGGTDTEAVIRVEEAYLRHHRVSLGMA